MAKLSYCPCAFWFITRGIRHKYSIMTCAIRSGPLVPHPKNTSKASTITRYNIRGKDDHFWPIRGRWEDANATKGLFIMRSHAIIIIIPESSLEKCAHPIPSHVSSRMQWPMSDPGNCPRSNWKEDVGDKSWRGYRYLTMQIIILCS